VLIVRIYQIASLQL